MLRRLWFSLVRLGFHLLYNEMAFTYDHVSRIVSLGAWNCWQRAGIDFLCDPGDVPVLELAHGTGDLQLDLYDAGYRAVGCDLSPFMGRIASHKLRRFELPDCLLRARAQQLPFSDGSFAAVIATFPTDFIIEPDTLREVHRVLVPCGSFVIVASGVFVGQGILKRLLEWAYQITGQRRRTNLDMSAYFSGYGFSAEMIEADCPGSRALIILAQKSDKLS